MQILIKRVITIIRKVDRFSSNTKRMEIVYRSHLIGYA